MKIALGQINPTVGDFSGNSSKIIDFSRRARSEGAGLVVFPEMSICGYPARDLVEKSEFVTRNRESALHIAQQTQGIAVICGLVTSAKADSGKSVMNSAAFLRDGRIEFIQSKMLLPTYDVFDEARYFAPAAKQELMPFAEWQVALTICEDAWNDKTFWPRRLYSVDPVEQLLKAGGNFLINASASPFSIGKRDIREKMFRNFATRHHVPVILVNQVGGNDNLIFDGASFAMAADGRVIVRARTFSEDLVIFDSADCYATSPDGKSGGGTSHGSQKDEAEKDDAWGVAAAYAALVMGTRDFVRKCGFENVLIGLSGGIDSALVAAIAVDALGKDHVIGVGMPGPYSSQGSIEDARLLSHNLGIRFEIVAISEIFDAYKCALQPVFSGTKEDATEENIQSRIRGGIIMALSNKFGAMVLNTGNKSELSVGYCTLYGDTVGGLGVISDVPKTMVYRLCAHVNSKKQVIPKSTVEKAPSAELRPNQQDTDSLPPYDILDNVLDDYVEEFKTAEVIATQRGYKIELVRKVISMVERSEYKRQQVAPGLKISDKAFGEGRRFPIAQKSDG